MREQIVLKTGQGFSVALDMHCTRPGCLAPEEPCEVCHGKGFVLSDEGRALAAFVRRHVIG